MFVDHWTNLNEALYSTIFVPTCNCIPGAVKKERKDILSKETLGDGTKEGRQKKNYFINNQERITSKIFFLNSEKEDI